MNKILLVIIVVFSVCSAMAQEQTLSPLESLKHMGAKRAVQICGLENKWNVSPQIKKLDICFMQESVAIDINSVTESSLRVFKTKSDVSELEVAEVFATDNVGITNWTKDFVFYPDVPVIAKPINEVPGLEINLEGLSLQPGDRLWVAGNKLIDINGILQPRFA